MQVYGVKVCSDSMSLFADLFNLLTVILFHSNAYMLLDINICKFNQIMLPFAL